MTVEIHYKSDDAQVGDRDKKTHKLKEARDSAEVSSSALDPGWVRVRACWGGVRAYGVCVCV